MDPNALKVAAGSICAAVTYLEMSHTVPAGVGAAVATILNFLIGMYHPQPAPKQPK